MTYSIKVVALLVFFFCCAAQLSATQQSAQPRNKIEFRLAETNPTKGLREVTTKDKGDKIYLHKEVIVTEADILGARLDVVANRGVDSFEIAVSFTEEGARKMAKATRGHIGKIMAILVDGQVVFALPVRSIIKDQCGITGQLTKEEAERITKAIASSIPSFLDRSVKGHRMPIKVEIRLAEPIPAEGLVEAFVLKPPYGQVYLRKEVLISNKDIVEASAVKGYKEGIFVVQLVLTKKAGEMLAKFSQDNSLDNMGRMIADLINGKVVSTGYIISNLDTTYNIVGEFNKEEAETIAAGINRR